MNDIMLSDIREHQMLVRGSEALRRAIDAARAGKDPRTKANLLWGMSSSPLEPDPGSQNSDKARRARARYEEIERDKEQQAEIRRTMRDPCPKCGTRMDIGCQHVKHLFTGEQLLTETWHVDRAWDRAIREAKGE